MTKLIQEETIFASTVRFTRLPTEGVVLFPAGGATPSVENTRYFYYTGGAVAITNFLNGSNVHTIYILGNANLTINNNANIKTNTGANKVLAANKVYTFHRINSVWYEVA